MEKEMRTICDYLKCTGCSACKSACVHKAISMVVTGDGFMYPQIDKQKCVDCGLCQKVCPANSEKRILRHVLNTFLCWDKNEQSRLQSSSGGMFSVIARHVISIGGAVCGAAYDDNMYLRHIIVDRIEDLPLLQGSKYIQSDVQDCYHQLVDILKEDRVVYFVGTPCQVAGLKGFLRKDYQNLITSDLICHGVPSAVLFQKQVQVLEQKYSEKIKDFRFRSKKRFGQGYDCELLLNSGRRKYLCAELVPYFYGFWHNLTLRESCYQCKYASIHRVGDITLGDFWLVKKVFPDVKTARGTSLILVNTENGQQLFNAIKRDICCRETSLESGVMGQGQLQGPVKRPVMRDSYTSCDLDALCKTILKIPTKYRFKCHFRNIVKMMICYKYWK